MSDTNNDLNRKEKLINIYKTEEEYLYANKLIEQINQDLELREKPSLVFNGVSYSQSYEYNKKKGINYAPPKSKTDDREISLGMIHEKIIGFTAIFLKYVFKRRVKCYGSDGKVIKGLGEFYDLAIEYSYKLEKFKKKLAHIYWEVFTQGNAFVLEDWQVRTVNIPKVKDKDGKVLDEDKIDYTYEYLDSLSYEKGEQVQYRKAVSVVLDGRMVIFGNPEIEEIQDQPRITIEDTITKADAEALFGSLSRWSSVPKELTEITEIIGKKITLFDANRHKDATDVYIRHLVLDKENNKFNIYLNGIMMLPSKTPMSIFYPRMNYPITNIPAERLKGSIYARSIPAKTKFNADYVDWAFKMLANKFEQGVNPAILSKSGKYTLTRKIFRAGEVTHGVSKDDYEKADPDNTGLTTQEFSFVKLLKDVVESQTINPTTAGELSANATATEIATVDNNQRDKLGFLLDGLVFGYMDMALRRAETIESKYTIKQRETVVDGKTIPVYQDFTVNVGGVDNVVVFDEEVGTPTYDFENKQHELFEKSFTEKKDGYPSEYYLVSPKVIRERKHNIDIEILPEKLKDSQLLLIQMWDEFTKLLSTFGRADQGGLVNVDELKKEYIEISGKSDKLFTTDLYKKLDENTGATPKTEDEAYNMGSFGKPTIKNAMSNVKTK